MGEGDDPVALGEDRRRLPPTEVIAAKAVREDDGRPLPTRLVMDDGAIGTRQAAGSEGGDGRDHGGLP